MILGFGYIPASSSTLSDYLSVAASVNYTVSTIKTNEFNTRVLAISAFAGAVGGMSGMPFKSPLLGGIAGGAAEAGTARWITRHR